MAKATIYIQKDNVDKWDKSTKSDWINQVLRDSSYLNVPASKGKVGDPYYDARLGRMVTPE